MQDIHYNMKHEEKKNQFDGFDCVLEFSLMFCKQKLLTLFKCRVLGFV